MLVINSNSGESSIYFLSVYFIEQKTYRQLVLLFKISEIEINVNIFSINRNACVQEFNI